MKASQNLLETGPCISVPITAANAELCNEILRLHRNEVAEPGNPSDRPHFDAAAGELIFQGELVREYAKKAKNCMLVLQAFQTTGWPRCIDDPLPGGKNSERLNNTVRTLNEGLHGIRFHAGGDGKSIRWRLQN